MSIIVRGANHPQCDIIFEEGGNLIVSEMALFCRQKLASFKVPKLIAFREEFPKRRVGKFLRDIRCEKQLGKMPLRNLQKREAESLAAFCVREKEQSVLDQDEKVV